MMLHAEFTAPATGAVVPEGFTVVTVLHGEGDTVMEAHVAEAGGECMGQVGKVWPHRYRDEAEMEEGFERLCAAVLALGAEEREEPRYLNGYAPNGEA